MLAAVQKIWHQQTNSVDMAVAKRQQLLHMDLVVFPVLLEDLAHGVPGDPSSTCRGVCVAETCDDTSHVPGLPRQLCEADVDRCVPLWRELQGKPAPLRPHAETRY